ncbi:MAG: acetolactate synthase small subunit [Planctomycetes bacterium]|nr:acetolactate synthase small subunit [Planctomycetota bacterium]MBM4082498.1 acetolactate synthase small subunit [Planctomycetota bacterium]MBM4087330.1 acetolactate synthase small subunit [Planctomycetota bacterium]
MPENQTGEHRHVISALVENKPGVLAHIATLFSGRGFNIDSLAVGETEDPTLSRMTIVVKGDDAIIEQVRKQLEKIITVIKVTDFMHQDIVERDLMLVRVNAAPGKRGEIIEIADIFRAKIVDVGVKDIIVELAGTEEKLQALLSLLRPYGIKEVARTGLIAMTRGQK